MRGQELLILTLCLFELLPLKIWGAQGQDNFRALPSLTGGPSAAAIDAVQGPVDSGNILAELTCAVQKVGRSANMKTIKEVSDGFSEVWNKLAAKGGKPPSKNERHHFYAQIMHESGGLSIMSEKGAGSKSVQSAPGGSKYKGRGPIQLTFCYHYAHFARFLRKLQGQGGTYQDAFSDKPETRGSCPKSDIASNPIVADPESQMGDGATDKRLAAMGSIFWWEKTKVAMPSFKTNLEKGADAVQAVSKTVNGGTNGLAERKKYFGLLESCMKGPSL